MLCIVSHGKRHAVYCVSWKNMLENMPVDTQPWYPVLWNNMLCIWSHEMIRFMSGGNTSLVSCLIKKNAWYHVSWKHMLGIMPHGKNAWYYVSWGKMLGIMSQGNTCLVSWSYGTKTMGWYHVSWKKCLVSCFIGKACL